VTVSEYQPPVKQSRILGAIKFHSADGFCVTAEPSPVHPLTKARTARPPTGNCLPRAAAPCPLEPRAEGMRILARSKRESGKARAQSARRWVAGKKARRAPCVKVENEKKKPRIRVNSALAALPAATRARAAVNTAPSCPKEICQLAQALAQTELLLVC